MRHDRRTVLAGGAAAAATFGLAGQAAAANHAVQIKLVSGQSKFEPNELRIKAGDTVKWTNKILVPHTVTCDPAKVKKAENCEMPAGAQPFDSGDLKQNATFEQRFRTKGTYKYFCKPHENMGMIGTVIVE